MNFASLLGKYFRHSANQYMRFDSAPGAVELPAPAGNTQQLLYLHVPICVVLCPFCSFHRVEFREDRASRYFRGLRQEVLLASGAGYVFSELYVGGGTPTVLPDELEATIRQVRRQHPIGRVSVETNPDDLDNDKVLRLRDSGVNRLSVGVQSFDDRLLLEMQRLDKYGSGQQIRKRLKAASGVFDTLNVDMIFNFPHQTAESLANDLHILTDELAADQVSFYPLMSADTTRKAMRKDIGEVSYGRERPYYEMIVAHMLSAGYTRSSSWCFSRQDSMIDEYIIGNNDYLGLGSGAFSYLAGSLYASTFSINHYLQLVESGRTGIVRRSRLEARERMRYHLLMQLFGGSLDIDMAEHLFDGRFLRTLRPEIAGLKLIRALRESERTLWLTERGNYLWVVMMREFFNGVNNFREQMRHGISAELITMTGR
jgi:coproporphyrinogen III oxidase-like Fe-S oxidoreductase